MRGEEEFRAGEEEEVREGVGQQWVWVRVDSVPDEMVMQPQVTMVMQPQVTMVMQPQVTMVMQPQVTMVMQPQVTMAPMCNNHHMTSWVLWEIIGC